MINFIKLVVFSVILASTCAQGAQDQSQLQGSDSGFDFGKIALIGTSVVAVATVGYFAWKWLSKSLKTTKTPIIPEPPVQQNQSQNKIVNGKNVNNPDNTQSQSTNIAAEMQQEPLVQQDQNKNKNKTVNAIIIDPNSTSSKIAKEAAAAKGKPSSLNPKKTNNN